MSFMCRNRLTSTLRNIHLLKRSNGTRNDKESPLRDLLQESSNFGEINAKDAELQWATEPYTSRGYDKPKAERVMPSDTSVVLFPGQGAHFVGMGNRLRDVPAARDLYELASSVVGWDVWRVCTEGPAEEMARRVQVCVVVTALAALERARELRPGTLERVRAAAGFSLGEVTALVFADALSFEDALRLVEIRAAAMSAAAAERPGGMLTVWLTPDADLPQALRSARDHAAERGVSDPLCVVANYLYPNCKVLAGDQEALSFVEQRGRKWGVKRTARVNVPGAFHCAAMQRAQGVLAEALRLVEVRAPRLVVVSGVNARALRDAGAVRRALARGPAVPLCWEQTLHALYARPRGEAFPFTLALGPGGATRATLRQVNARAWDTSLQIDV